MLVSNCMKNVKQGWGWKYKDWLSAKQRGVFSPGIISFSPLMDRLEMCWQCCPFVCCALGYVSPVRFDCLLYTLVDACLTSYSRMEYQSCNKEAQQGILRHHMNEKYNTKFNSKKPHIYKETVSFMECKKKSVRSACHGALQSSLKPSLKPARVGPGPQS